AESRRTWHQRNASGLAERGAPGTRARRRRAFALRLRRQARAPHTRVAGARVRRQSACGDECHAIRESRRRARRPRLRDPRRRETGVSAGAAASRRRQSRGRSRRADRRSIARRCAEGRRGTEVTRALPLAPPPSEAPARGLGRAGVAFGRRTIWLLLIGLLW